MGLYYVRVYIRISEPLQGFAKSLTVRLRLRARRTAGGCPLPPLRGFGGRSRGYILDLHTYIHTDIQTYRHTDIHTHTHIYIIIYI